MTLLSEENAGASANCNAAGQTMGVFVGYGVFMSLYSADFCNKWLRTVPSDKGVVTIEDAVLFYALIFLVVTTLIAIFKKERDLKTNDKPPTIFTTYKTMLKVIFLGLDSFEVRKMSNWSNFLENNFRIRERTSETLVTSFIYNQHWNISIWRVSNAEND